MATKKSLKTGKNARSKPVQVSKDAVPKTEPKFPYTTKPGSLRRLLKEIPKVPKPQKVSGTLLKSLGFKDQNDFSMIRVLKAVGLLDGNNQPSDKYASFMSLDGGGKVLASEIRRVYAPLFQASHTPYSETNEKLKSLFNIHSGGGERTLDQQIQTFKVLCEFASFDVTPQGQTPIQASPAAGGGATPILPRGGQDPSYPSVNINLHIHLPENKSRRDYEDIIEDIGRYIFG
jgi:hypothetical protein